MVAGKEKAKAKEEEKEEKSEQQRMRRRHRHKQEKEKKKKKKKKKKKHNNESQKEVEHPDGKDGARAVLLSKGEPQTHTQQEEEEKKNCKRRRGAGADIGVVVSPYFLQNTKRKRNTPCSITTNDNNDIHISLVFGLPSSSPSVVQEDHNHTPSPLSLLCHSNPNDSVMEIDTNREKKTTKKKRKNKRENGIDLDVEISKPGVNGGLTCSLSKDGEDPLSVSDGNIGSSSFVADLNSVGKKEIVRDLTSLNTEGRLIGTKRLDEVLSQFVYKGGDMMMRNTVQRHRSYSPYFAKVVKNEQRNEEKEDNKTRMESQAICNKVDNEVVCSSTIQGNLHSRKARRREKQEPQNGTSCVKVRKVSPYFHSTIEQQMPLKERQVQGIKMKALRKCEKPRSTVRKVSPYFQKESKEEEIADNGSAEGKSGHKKLPKLSTVLSKSQKLDEAYQRKTPDNTWKPPRSERGLLQEDHADDPWRVLLICMLLNRTTGLQETKS